MMKKVISWTLALYIAFVFIRSLFFKFSGAMETVIIFETISDWMDDIKAISFIAPFFSEYGGLTIGVAELLASILMLIPASRKFGALLALMIISGAIFFHLATPLRVNRSIDAAGNTEAVSFLIWRAEYGFPA